MKQSRSSSLIYIVAGLIALMVVTRWHHFGSVAFLPDASLAVFFLAGLWVGSRWLLWTLVGVAVLVDTLAIQVAGVGGSCVTPAYGFLLLSYGVTWLAGRWSGRALERPSPLGYARIAAIALATFSLAFVISNASFYALSGYFTDLSVAQYAAQVATYYLSYSGWSAFYLALGLALRHAIAHPLPVAALTR
ncbi:MAG: hypothetical protein ACFCUG_00270 [Thiotrichales bacterium]